MIENELKSRLSDALDTLFGAKIPMGEIQLQPTRKEFSGTYTFVVFPYLKLSGKNPEETGNMIGEFVQSNSTMVKGFNVVKGFLNFEIEDSAWLQTLETMRDLAYGRHAPNGKRVMVEFSSPNTNKPLHLGHMRNIFLGDSLSRILEAAGYQVMRVNLVNDRGIHICKSMLAYQKWGNGETPESADVKGDHLIGKYYVLFDKHYRQEIADLINGGMDGEKAKKEAALILEAQAMLQRWEQGDEATVALWKKMNGWVYDGFYVTYATMGVEFDKFYYESNTYLLGKDLVDQGVKSGVFTRRADNSVWVDLTAEGLDEKLVLRSDGTSVYITQDMGTCELKYQDFPFDKSVYVVGNEQDYHFQVLFSIMKKLGRPYADGLYHLSYGMVDLPSGKMKSREGTVVDADELLKEMFETAERHTRELGKIEGLGEEEAKELFRMLGLGAVKYYLVRVDPKKRMLFNPEQSIEFQGDTGPFIQYTYARISAILRRAETLKLEGGVKPGLALNSREAELIYRLSLFPQIVKSAGEEYAPSVLAQYVYEVAKDYNGFYQEVPIFGEENKDLMKLRILLSDVTAHVIRTAMDLLGIGVPERM
jgi:arginyl-tRNA synthetase